MVVGQGIAKASARTIATEAGVNQALVFYHFGSVDELLAAACEHGARQRIAAHRDALAAVKGVAGLVSLARSIHAQEQAAGNVETLHTEAVARHTAEVEAERAERIDREDSEQQAPLAAPAYFRTVTRPADPAERRRQEQQHGHEQERER